MMKVMKPYCMLISTPRSGSTWLYHCLVEAMLPNLSACPEFFNPHSNKKYKQMLISFGSNDIAPILGNFPFDAHLSLISKKNIAHPHKDLEHAFQNTWMAETYTFTKEVWSIYNIHFFKKYFNCIGLIRPHQHTFPGRSPELTKVLYIAMYESLLHNFNLQSTKTQKDILNLLEGGDILTGTHAIYNEKLRESQIPIIDYDKLITLSRQELKNYLEPILPKHIFSTMKAVETIIKTRKRFYNTT